MDKNRLRSLMYLNGDSQRELAKFLGLTEQTVTAKINEKNDSEFTQGEITMMKDRYHLTTDDVDAIFFNVKVS